MSIGKELQRLRKARGLTLDDLQRLSGVSRDTLSRIERGKHAPHDATLRAVVRALTPKAEDATDPRLLRIVNDEGSQSSRPPDRLEQLLSYVRSLSEKERAQFITAAIAALQLFGRDQSGTSAAIDVAQKHGR